jgi:hypothetical protein
LVQTRYIVEPLDMLGPDSPVNEIAAMKQASAPRLLFSFTY